MTIQNSGELSDLMREIAAAREALVSSDNQRSKSIDDSEPRMWLAKTGSFMLSSVIVLLHGATPGEPIVSIARICWPVGARQEQWLRAYPQATAAQAATLAPRPPSNARVETVTTKPFFREPFTPEWRTGGAVGRKIAAASRRERIMKEIRRRTRVVGAFPDGQSCLNLAAARVRHIAGTTWSAKCYMNMRPLYQQQQSETEAVA